MHFIPVMANVNIQQQLLQSSVSYDPSEISKSNMLIYKINIYIYIFVTLLSLLTNLIHPYWIKVWIYLKIEK